MVGKNGDGGKSGTEKAIEEACKDAGLDDKAAKTVSAGAKRLSWVLLGCAVATWAAALSMLVLVVAALAKWVAG